MGSTHQSAPPVVQTRSLKARATPATPAPTFRSTPAPQPCVAGDENTAGLTVGMWGERGQGAMSLPLATAVSVCGPRPHPGLAAAPPSTYSPWTGAGGGFLSWSAWGGAEAVPSMVGQNMGRGSESRGPHRSHSPSVATDSGDPREPKEVPEMLEA